MKLAPKDFERSSSKQPKRIASNALVLFVRMLVITVVNLYAVRLVLNGMGCEDYGIFNVVVGVVMTCSCVFPVLAVSVQRFYSYAMGCEEWGRLREIFSASVNIIVVSLAVILLLLETVGLYFIREKLQIPVDRLDESVWIFHFAMVTFAFSYLQIPYTAALFAHEDMDMYAYVSCLDCVLKLGAALLIGRTCFSGLATYGAGLAVVAVCTWLCYVAACAKYSECRYQWIRSHGIYKELLSFSGWTMYGAFAGIGMIQGNNILLNLFFGPLANTAFGVAANIYNAFTSLSNSVVLSFRPQMIKSYAAKDFSYLDSLFRVNNKFLLYLLSGVAIPIVFEMQTILEIWLGEVSADMIVFSRLFIVYAVLLALHNPITILMQASGHIRTYHLIVESIMILCLPITWVLFRTGMPSPMAFVSMIVLCAVAHGVRLVCLKRNQTTFSVRSYFFSIVFPGALVVGLAVVAASQIHGVILPGLVRLTVMLSVSPLVTFGLAYFIGITKHEKAMVNNMVGKLLKR